MISWAWVRIPMGRKSPSTPYLAAEFLLIWGVMEEVAQVSSTADSGTNSVPPHSQVPPQGVSSGLTGSVSGSAKWALPHFLQYHTGKGTPKYRCREMHQSHFRFSTQFT